MRFVKVMQLVHRLHTDSNGRFYYSSVVEELSEVLYSGENFAAAQDFYYAYCDSARRIFRHVPRGYCVEIVIQGYLNPQGQSGISGEQPWHDRVVKERSFEIPAHSMS